MARFPWSLVFDRTFSLSFPRIAYEEKGMSGKGMSGKGMGTDWRSNSHAQNFFAPKFACPLRLRRLGIAVGIDHRLIILATPVVR